MSRAGRQHSLRRMMAWIAGVAVVLGALRFAAKWPGPLLFVLLCVVPLVILVLYFAKVVIPVGLIIRSVSPRRGPARPWPVAAVVGLSYWATVVLVGAISLYAVLGIYVAVVALLLEWARSYGWNSYPSGRR